MNQIFLNHLQQLLNCDPTKCIGTQCPNYYADEDKCMYAEIASTCCVLIKEKFKGRNKEIEE